ncbi:hypothetical protein D3Z58_03260 [Clostridiaceae bacterium]|nr:hypothetical protein [Clostridiaceae bacterium]
MDKFQFKSNLLQALNEEYETPENVRFMITTDQETDKKHNSKDDFMRLTVFHGNNINGRLFDIEQMKTSLRFRKPSEIKHKETGHPPFIVSKE